MDIESLSGKLTAVLSDGEYKSANTDAPFSSQCDKRSRAQQTLTRQKRLADKRHNRKKSQASKLARRINR